MKIISLTLILPFLILSACSSGPANGPRATLGSPDAPVLIEEFSDLQCPACGVISPQVAKWVKTNPDSARLEFFHFPLPQHSNAFRAAEAAGCAHGQAKFWEFSDLAFRNQQNLSDEGLENFAQTLALDMTAFKKCLSDGSMKDRVRADLKFGDQRRVSFTPSFYVNGQLVQFTDLKTFSEYVTSLVK